jgi:trans-2,3-dihydro-3-hydroxyanthranilate isomerase
MIQPTPVVTNVIDATSFLAALGLERSELPIEHYDNGVSHIYIGLPREAAVTALRPDFAALAHACHAASPAILGVNCVAGGGRRWKTRMFAPAAGIPEDSATGSAAGPLACWLARHGRIIWGEEIEISQGDEIGRPSLLYARVDGELGRITEVAVGGEAVIVGRGEFLAQVVGCP